MSPRWVALAPAVLILALCATTVSGNPQGSDFTISPNPPNPGEVVTFTFVPGPELVGDVTVEWDIRGNESFDETGSSATQSYDNPGPVTVTMRVTDEEGPTEVQKTFNVNAPPVVDFSFAPTSPLPGEEVVFTPAVSDPNGDDVTLSWSFGSGSTQTGANSATYSSPGTRTVTLTATDEHGGTSSKSKEITVQNRLPVVDFSFTPTSPLPEQQVVFTPAVSDPDGDDVTLSWSFGSGSTQTGANSATYSSPGTRTVTLTATDERGGTSSKSKQITVANRPPSVDFDFLPTSPLPGEVVLFSPDVSDPDGDAIVSQSWNFGPGATQTGTNSASYSTPGTRTVSLTATDSRGDTTTKSREITVRDLSGPTADFSFSPTVPLIGQVVTFTNTSVPSGDEEIKSVAWDLDNDGSFDDDPDGWSFGASGTHLVSLRVTQTGNSEAVVEKPIRVNAPPAAAFVWSPLAPLAGQAVDLISISSDAEGALAAQTWDLDADGIYDDAIGSRVSHTFPAAGSYDIGVQVTDSDGVARTSREQVAVAPSPIPPTTPVDTSGNGEPVFITPFPIVRLAGTVLPHAARVEVLAVRAPRGASIRVKCTGRGCPVGSARRTSRGRSVRFKQFERRLRAGITLELFVRKQDMIGKYTRFLIRAGKAPLRTDRCLMPGRPRPVRCP